MKTTKYRSVFGTLCVAALSVFLFTACEKETDSVNSSPTKADRLSKFKSLVFSGSGTGGATSSTSGSGTFIGGGSSNISYTPPFNGGGTGNGATWAPTVPSGGEFTDPMSTGNQFVVGTPFSTGAGSLTYDGTTYPINFGFCASEDIFRTDINSRTEGSLELFIGVIGDFDVSMIGEDEPDDLGINLLLYVFSYNGSSNIGSFDNFEEGTGENSAFVIIAEYMPGEDEDAILSFAKSGTVDFSGNNVTLSNTEMATIIETEIEPGQFINILSQQTKNLEASLECTDFEFDDEED